LTEILECFYTAQEFLSDLNTNVSQEATDYFVKKRLLVLRKAERFITV
jgi:hypothetical protein